MALKGIRNLDYVVLLCDDLAAMAQFYRETLDFPVYRALEGWIEFQVGACQLTLRERGRPYDGPREGKSAGVQLAFRVTLAEVDAAYSELLERGVEVVEAPKSYRFGEGGEYGHRTVFFKDPEGNILEIYAELQGVI